MNEDQNIKNLIQKCEKEIAQLDSETEREKQRERVKNLWIKYSGDDEIISSEEYQKLAERQEQQEQLKIYSEIPKLDEIIDGFRNGNLVVISGATKQGKTQIAQTFTENMDEKVLWFTYEVPPREFLEKFNEIPLFYLPKTLKGNTTNWVEKKIVEGIAKYDIKAVFIDHLHYIVDIKSHNVNMSLQIGSVMRELKKMAIKWNIVIFLIAHLRKTKTLDVPDLDDIRDSSLIAQESDIVMFMSRLKDKETGEYINEALLSVKAHRRTGKCGNIKLVFNNNKFLQVEENYDEPSSI